MKNKLLKRKLQGLNVDQLRTISKEQGLKNYSKKRKDDLINHILTYADKEDLVKTIDKLNPKNIAPQKESIFKKLKKNWVYVVGLSTVIVIIANSIKIFEYFKPASNKKKTEATFTDIKSEDIYKVLILPFKPDTDCTIKDTDYEYQLISRYNKIKKEENIPLEVIFDKSNSCPLDGDQAYEVGKKKGADIVIWGNFLEECEGEDSITLKYRLIKNVRVNKPVEWESNLTALNSVYDLKEGILQENIDYIIYWTLSLRSYEKYEFKNALSYLDKIIDSTQCNEEARRVRMDIFVAQNKMDASLAEVDFLIDCAVENATFLYYKARMFMHLNKLDSAKFYFRKSLESKPNLYASEIELVYLILQREIGTKTFQHNIFSLPILTNYQMPKINEDNIFAINGLLGVQLSKRSITEEKKNILINKSKEIGNRIWDEMVSYNQLGLPLPAYGDWVTDLMLNWCRAEEIAAAAYQLNNEFTEAIKVYTQIIDNYSGYSKDSYLEQLYTCRALMYNLIGNKTMLKNDIENALKINPGSNAAYLADFKLFKMHPLYKRVEDYNRQKKEEAMRKDN